MNFILGLMIWGFL